MSILEQMKAIRTLAEGMDLKEDSSEHQLLLAIVRLLDDLTVEVDDLYRELVIVDEFNEDIDDAVAELEYEVFGDVDSADEEIDLDEDEIIEEDDDEPEEDDEDADEDET